jgi:hypothetical protein
MKPISLTTHNSRSFPLVEFHYHAPMLNGATASSVTTSKSLRDISRDYFDAEANREFTTEAAVFGTLILVAIVPIMTGISAVLQLLGSLPLF